MDIEGLLKNLVEGGLSHQDYLDCADQLECSLPDVFNRLSILLAKRFVDGDLSFVVADEVANCIWASMLDFTHKNRMELAEPCYSIYCAFDAGEYDHRDNSDPVEKYTKSELKEILRDTWLWCVNDGKTQNQ